MKLSPGPVAAALAMSVTVADAASLRVSPILIESAAGKDVVVTLRNQEVRPMNAQVRVFRWTQRDGQDQLDPTDDVMASPPILTIAPGEDYTVRLQRTTGSEPVAEEAYRVVVDELPNPDRQRNGTVAVVLRYLVPAFFFPPDAGQPRLRWSLQRREGRTVIVAENEGDRRAQISDLALRGGSRTAPLFRGLAGYVLGHSTKEWRVDPNLAARPGSSIMAMSDRGPIHAPLAR